MPNRDYKDERREYEYAHLNREDVHLDPYQQFAEWMDTAQQQGVIDPTAMTLSTVTPAGQPRSRIVLLKEFDNQGFVFYTHYHSHKGDELTQNSRAALLFFWPELDRQVRIEGQVKRVSNEQSDQYFQARPLDSQLSATVSKQSQKVPGRKTLELNLEIAKSSFMGNTIERPAHWGGYCLQATYFEYWQGRQNRLHDRFQYVQTSQANHPWQISRLAP